MAFLQCEFFSEALGVCSSMNVIIPQESSAKQIGVKAAHGKGLPPLLYLLHGYSDNYTIWMRRTSVERYASESGLAVIMPAVNLSYYADMQNGSKYWSFISEELPQIVHSLFKLSQEPEKTFVAGLSMGGYGAFKLALTYPERYKAAASFSGALDIHAIYATATGDKKKNLDDIFGSESELDNSNNDLFYLASKLAVKRKKVGANKLHLPKLYQACGTSDFLYQANIKFRDYLRSKKFELTYEATKGKDHTWDYWDFCIKRFISIIQPKYLLNHIELGALRFLIIFGKIICKGLTGNRCSLKSYQT